MVQPMMEFVPGVVSDNGATLLVAGEPAVKLPLRDRDDQALKLEPGVSVVLYGTVVAKRSKRTRRLLVHEVFVQTALEIDP